MEDIVFEQVMAFPVWHKNCNMEMARNVSNGTLYLRTLSMQNKRISELNKFCSAYNIELFLAGLKVLFCKVLNYVNYSNLVKSYTVSVSNKRRD